MAWGLVGMSDKPLASIPATWRNGGEAAKALGERALWERE